jgi:hypothetical protein
MTDDRFDARAIRQWLLDRRNADEGWGYAPGKASRLEPTCWALLALDDIDPQVLKEWPTSQGLLRERREGGVNVAFHALALLALTARGVEHAGGNGALASGLEQASGLALGTSPVNRQDNTLQGWSWITGTFSWVEPTAWAVLALRKWKAAGGTVDASRVDVGETLLADRCCVEGGWNYGNSNMLGKELRPYVPTTALGLLALQKRAVPAVTKSLQRLEQLSCSEPSAVALSLAVIGLSAYGRSCTAARSSLAARATVTADIGSVLGVAMALHAMQPANGSGAFVH